MELNEYRIRNDLKGPAARLKLQVHEEVTSTNDLLKDMALEGAPGGTVLLAAAQTGGRGRMGRSFYSPPGTGLYMSLLLRPSMKAEPALAVTTLAAVAAAEAVERLPNVKGQCSIKWVNDLELRGRKIAGILTEGRISPGGAEAEYLIMGIGFNVREPEEGFPRAIAETAGAIYPPGTSKADEDFVRERLASGFLNAFMERWTAFEETGIPAYMEEYRRRCSVLGKTVTLLGADHLPLPDQPAVTVVGIGDGAQLIAAYPDGSRKCLSSGEISIRV
ncbi:MAG: biotin--[acetyl-CoA-carboxylase] ligase [Lachnospiraceae bacterium]|nr:biotin--[acetyl-CoA-carboxylase] ligase [Lachnospiraceae bacterium]